MAERLTTRHSATGLDGQYKFYQKLLNGVNLVHFNTKTAQLALPGQPRARVSSCGNKNLSGAIEQASEQRLCAPVIKFTCDIIK